MSDTNVPTQGDMQQARTGGGGPHVKTYIMVFIALAVLTGVTVLAAGLDFAVAMAIAVGLLIAIVKGSLVALFFMHLSHEKKLIYFSLLLTVIFFFALLLLPFFTQIDSFQEEHHVYSE